MTSYDTSVFKRSAIPRPVIAAQGVRLPEPPQTSRVEQLVVQASRGCRQSFDQLTTLYEKKLLGFFYARTGRLADAEDLAQETLILAWRKMDQFRHSGSFEGWLFSIAINRLHSRIRNRRFFLPLSDMFGSSVPGPGQAANTSDQVQQFWKTVRQHLSYDQFNALLMRYRSGLSVEETAQAMGKSRTSVKVLLHRGKCRLHQRLSQTSFLQDFLAQNSTNSGTF